MFRATDAEHIFLIATYPMSNQQDDLWNRYTLDPGNTALRDQLIERYLPEVNRCAARTASRVSSPVDQAALCSALQAAVKQCVERWNPHDPSGVTFASWLSFGLRQAGLQEIRRQDPLSRAGRAKQKQRTKIADQLGHELGYRPSQQELDKAWQQAGVSQNGTEHGTVQLNNVQNPRGDMAEAVVASRGDDRGTLAAVLEITAGVAPSPRKVLVFQYVYNLTFQQIASILSVSVTTVHRHRNQALCWIRQNRPHLRWFFESPERAPPPGASTRSGMLSRRYP